jgi:HPt (histidine-containing phosphotransfer) domain-containing protein
MTLESPDLAAALNQLWIKFVPEIRERVAILENASHVLVAGEITTEQRETAHAAAHKLAGTLGTFNLARGTELARQFEYACATEESCAAADAQQLAAIAAEIRALIDSRD